MRHSYRLVWPLLGARRQHFGWRTTGYTTDEGSANAAAEASELERKRENGAGREARGERESARQETGGDWQAWLPFCIPLCMEADPEELVKTKWRWSQSAKSASQALNVAAEFHTH